MKASAKPKKKDTKPVSGSSVDTDYSAKDIEILEGLEPVRRRPGMYIGGTDSHAMHHLAAEIIDNSMDEAVAGHASRIEFELKPGNIISITDNGRGIPTDQHPKFKDKSALEVILTTLHSGGKFDGKAYETSGGLHGVGLSVVNALSEWLRVEVARDKKVWQQDYAFGAPTSKLNDLGATNNRRGTTISFKPDSGIFGEGSLFEPALLYRMARSKAYLFRGVEIRWSCDPELLEKDDKTPEKANLHFPGGLIDFLKATMEGRRVLTPEPFSGLAKMNGTGKAEWAIAWPLDEEPYFSSYCNTVPTPLGGTHESGFRSGMLRALKNHAELLNFKQASKITADDLIGGSGAMLSVFIPEPQFQGQTKEKLVSVSTMKMVENIVRDNFEHWLSADPETARAILDHTLERAEQRLRKRQDKQTKRQSATRRLRLPGKLSDCTRSTSEGTEVFLVEGDSAGGSAKQGRRRDTQAVLPLRGKILNVASATRDKMMANQELKDLIEALGCGTGSSFDVEKLRYEKVIIMTDADVDGAHIAALLITFFFKEMTQLIENGNLYIAMPPLYRITQGSKMIYARDDDHKDELLETEFNGRGKIEISRFKGLGEMPPQQLKETTMDPEKRTLIRVTVPMGTDAEDVRDFRTTSQLVETLMGKKPEKRFAYIQEHAQFVEQIDV
ncbi:MAG: DNA topoisomerase IV subunit B [Rhodospirillales bacterium]|nr:DNA topoisomerase IV subunit B [Rhodospirillales bacterium]